MSNRPVILTYHSQNILGDHAPVNDHQSLARDLEAIHGSGRRFISLARLIDRLDEGSDLQDLRGCVCLTLDDGCNFDVHDMEWPGAGLQRSMLGILRDFSARHGAEAQPGLHATSFVIASPQARELIDRGSLLGRGWMGDDWWAAAEADDRMTIASHGWDHLHPDLGGSGCFGTVDDWSQCETQVIRSARYIERRTGKWPDLFAYPFGTSSSYIREEFFPRFRSEHRCRAALGTDAGTVRPDTDRWNLPRLVCGRDWRSPGELLQLIESL